MKASYRKHKTGFHPVIIFNDKSRMTHRVSCYSKETAIKLAEKVIADIELYQNPVEDHYVQERP